MPRSPLYNAGTLEVDYDEATQKYSLTRDNNIRGSGSTYNERQISDLIHSLRQSIQSDSRFRNTRLEITQRAQAQLEERANTQ